MAETRPPAGGLTTARQEGQQSQHDGQLSNQTSATTLPELDEGEWTYEKQLKVGHKTV